MRLCNYLIIIGTVIARRNDEAILKSQVQGAPCLSLPMANVFKAYGLIPTCNAFISVAPVQDPDPKEFPAPALVLSRLFTTA